MKSLSSETELTPTRQLAGFCAGLKYEDLPEVVIRKAKLCILDYIANIYGSLSLDPVLRLVSYFKKIAGSGTISALGCGFKTIPHYAVFINGTTAEAVEAQDGYRFGGNHPGTAVIPAALAAAEEKQAGGRAVIEAMAAGYEAANRPAAAMHPWHTLSGFLPTGTCGAFGAAAAAARVYGYDAAGMLNALSNAGYLLPLSMAEQLMGGFTIKIVQAGQAAAAGLLAAGLAGAGLTGFAEPLEGSPLKGGFTQITTRADPKIGKLTEALGEHFTLSDIYLKPYCACRHTHGAIQAALEIVAKNRIQIEEIEKIDVFTYGIAQLAVGKHIQPGDSFVCAQFSIPYVVAAAIVDGELGPDQLSEKRMADPGLLTLAGRVRVKTDETLNSLYPEKTASRVEITLTSGKTLSRQVDMPRGDPRDPLTEAEIIDKLKRYGRRKNGRDLDKLVSQVLDLERITDIRALTALI